MINLVAIFLGIAAGLATGGSLQGLQQIQRLRWIWVVLIALAVRLAVVLPPLRGVEGVQYIYAASFAVLVAWIVWNVTRLRGLWIVAIGATLNLLVIVSNGGRMPVANSVTPVRGVAVYTTMSSSTNLNWLGDWITLPVISPGSLLGGVYSPGDVILGVGILVTAFMLTRAQERPAETPGRIVS
jgi:Family of unknown function (DUF5317)